MSMTAMAIESTSGSSSASSIGRLGADEIRPMGYSSGGSFYPQGGQMPLPPPMDGSDEAMQGQNGEDLGPVPRDRCNTWPLRRPQLDINAQTSPLIHEQIPEEDLDLYDSSENVQQRLGASSQAGSQGLLGSPDASNFSPGMASPVMNGAGGTGGMPPSSAASDTSDSGCPGAKKSTTRRNAWGNMSYADLITQAIIQSPEKRLTLSQVYEWMVQNVPYFRDKGDSNSSAGWKNSIRHNLSLHSRFMRIQNEGAGKSSWWVINPDAKPGRNPRRQRANTLESSTKAQIDKKRRGAKRKVMEQRLAGSQGLHSTGSSVVGSQASIISHELYNDAEDSLGHGFDGIFRARTQSNLSVPGSSSRVSPQMEQTFDDFDFPPWVDAAAPPHPIPSDILDRTDQMRLADPSMDPNSPAFRRGPPMQQQPTMINGRNGELRELKQEPKMIKQEPGVAPPPSYHELNSVRGPQQLQNPLLRTQLQQQIKMPPVMNPGRPFSMNYYPQQMYGGGQMNQGGWPQVPTSNGSSHMQQMNSHSCAASSVAASVSSSALPVDLENLSLPDQPLMEMDMEALLRHELAQTRDNQLNFDI